MPLSLQAPFIFDARLYVGLVSAMLVFLMTLILRMSLMFQASWIFQVVMVSASGLRNWFVALTR